MEILAKITVSLYGIMGVVIAIRIAIDLIKEIKESGWDLEVVPLIPLAIVMFGLGLMPIIALLSGAPLINDDTDSIYYRIAFWMFWWTILK